ncbi:hypothetical protein LCGC14_0390560 [marine sediment metagenome]|uniref:Uncharacterized protein n=1 Tax=marine sediment metagenome TaxID=412755 RepID=A0A0F9VLS9_9ZZZZ
MVPIGSKQLKRKDWLLLAAILVFIVCMAVFGAICDAGTWDIGAVQLEGGATDIGGVQAAPAAAVPGGQVIMIQVGAISIFALVLIKRRLQWDLT